jgi:hypothetical protein
MLRKILMLGALALVALAFGVSGAAAARHGNPGGGGAAPGYSNWVDGFSDGRL